MKLSIFLPERKLPVPESDVWKWYLNIPQELELPFLSPEEKDYYREYYREAGLLRDWRRPFFRHHFCRTFTQVVNYLFSHNLTPTILELGCGYGTQSLFLALMGARVIGIDIDEIALAILKKRQEYLEDKVGIKLDVRIYSSDVFTFDFASIAPFDGVYSMFAFNMMRPSRWLLDRICPNTSKDSRFAILDGNCVSWKSRIMPSSNREGKLSPIEFEDELRKRSFTIDEHTCGFAIPPIFWWLIPGSVLKGIENTIGNNWFMPISHQVLAVRNSASTPIERIAECRDVT